MRRSAVQLVIVTALLLKALCASAQTGNPRVDALLAKMTLAEKIAMLHGSGEDAASYQGEAGYLAGVQRLGIPPMRFADGPPGILSRIPAAAPPSTMALAATFSADDAREIGALIGREAKARGISVALQPFINIDRDFTFERGYNTFGEDPLLTAVLGAEEIRGVQSQGVMAQAKHYVAYDTISRNVWVDEQTLHEVYLQPFRAAVEAGVASLMCSYNRINGVFACGNATTLTDILRNEMHFGGFVTSDWGAVHGTDYLNAGLDMEMPGPLAVPWNIPSYFVNQPTYPRPDSAGSEGHAITEYGLPEEPRNPPYEPSNEAMPATNLAQYVRDGVVSEATITRAAGRILLQMDRFGLLDGSNTVKIVHADDTADLALLEKVAADAAVLLKNDDSVLPLAGDALRDVAVIGPGGAQTVAVGLTGEKAVGLPAIEQGPLAALRELAPAGSRFTYAAADDMEGTPVPADALSHFGEPGLLRRMWNENAVSIDPQIAFTVSSANALPAEANVVWTGDLTVAETGSYRLHLQLLGCYGKLLIDEKPVAKTWFNWIHGEVTQAGQDNIFPTTDGLDNLRAAVDLTAGVHHIRVEVAPDTSHQPVQVRLNWVTPSQQQANYGAALDAARNARVAVVFAWSRTRPAFALPGDQDRLIHDVAKVNPHTVVVLNVSQPVAMPWLGEVAAVLDAGWTGDRGGPATAKVLLGRVNPGGRLPFSWPKVLSDMPATDPRHPENSSQGVNGRTDFGEGLFVGYRWLAHQHITPLFPFGYGLSYSRFKANVISAKATQDGGADVSVEVTNTSTHDGDDVVQLYLDRPAKMPAGVSFADFVLAAFTRTTVAAGSTVQVNCHIGPERFLYWDVATRAWRSPGGVRTIWAGDNASARGTAVQIKPVAVAQDVSSKKNGDGLIRH